MDQLAAGSSTVRRAANTVSFVRLAWILVPALAAVVGGAYWLAVRDDPLATHAGAPIGRRVLAMFLSVPLASEPLNERFADANGDLVADAVDSADWLDPSPLVFSYVATEAETESDDAWAGLIEHLSQAADRPVELVRFRSPDEQWQALDEGRLHLTAFNSGAVPTAVSQHGFAPLCCPGTTDGKFGYRMWIVVPHASPINTLGDLAGHLLAFTHLSSNSGFKAPLMVLREQCGLLPERDYHWAFSGSHLASIEGVVKGRYAAAAVASDLVEQWVAADAGRKGELRTLYESERFPPAALGCSHRLRPDLAARLLTALLEFRFEDSELEAVVGAPGTSCFVPVNYKDDWALIRQVDETLNLLRE